MSSPYVGEIRMFGGNFAPAGWMLCQGQVLAIADYDVLVQLIGTTYGGDGQTTFALPNLQSRFPVHQGTVAGQTFVIGAGAGEEQVTLTTTQLPTHGHLAAASNALGDSGSPANSIWAVASQNASLYAPGAATDAMNPGAIAPAGGNQPHDNMSPFLAINFIISLFGIFPSPT